VAWCDPFVPDVLRKPFETILDVGSGDGKASLALHNAGRKVTSIDLTAPKNPYPWQHFVGDFMEWDFGRDTYDAVLASAIIEHIQDTGAFLRKVRGLLRPDGWIFLFAPHYKSEIVGGHLHYWNTGLLMYNLILAGFDCLHGHFGWFGYLIAAFVQPTGVPLPPLVHDAGDIERLADHFPIPVWQGFEGDIERVNWPPKQEAQDA